jgi:hypothetical protein
VGQEREAARTLFKSQAGKELLAQAAAVRARVALVPPQGDNFHRGVLYRVVGSCLAKLWKALFLWERASRQLNVPSWRYDPLTRFQPRRLIAGSFCVSQTAIANAKSAEEVDRLEYYFKQGQLPPDLMDAGDIAPGTAPGAGVD